MDGISGENSMIYYDWYSLDTVYDPSTAPVPANFQIPYIAVSYNDAGTSATLTITTPNAGAESYGGSLTLYSFNDPYRVVNSNSSPITITGLTPGTTYSLRIRAYSQLNQTGVHGDYYYDTISTPKPAVVTKTNSTTSATQTPPDTEFDEVMTMAKVNQLKAAQAAAAAAATAAAAAENNDSANANVNLGNKIIETGTAVAVSGDRAVQTSLFSIVNNSPDKNEYSLAVKNCGISTSYSYYAFGTSLFFESVKQNINGAGGIGFFTSNNGLTGYYVLVQTTSNLSDTADKEIKIIKMVNGKKIVLNDNQKGVANQYTGILGGQIYKLDINVVVTSTSRKIEVYINNFKITVTDTTKSGTKLDTEKVLPVTSGISMCSSSGKTSFDYIYATPLTEAQYNEGVIQNVYEGKYGVKTLSFLFGDKVISNKTVSPDQLSFMEEFGTVARELKKIKIKYEARPGSPMYTSTGINKYINILGQRLTSFGAEVYVINNSGTFVPLDDSDLYSFSVVGNYIVVSGQHEYVSNTLSENTIPEPVIFESSWIQTESDAKNLTTWIQDQWSKKQQVIDLEVFSNPLISVGDIISVNYSSNGLDGTQKFIVTKINNSFGEGLSTTITARSIYS